MKRFAIVIGLMLVGTSSMAIAQIDIPIAIDVISQGELEATNVVDIAALLENLPEVSRYRFGDDPFGMATLGPDVVPLSMPDAIGAGVVRTELVSGDNMRAALVFGDIQDNVRDASMTFVQSGDGLEAAAAALFLIASMNEPSNLAVSVPANFHIQTELVIAFDEMPGWQAADAYPGDTWQGGSLIASGQQIPGEPPTFDLIDANNDFASIPFNGFFGYHDDWVIIAVDLETLESYGGPDMTLGYALHAHDGSYGACEDCLSTVTAWPAFDATFGREVVGVSWEPDFILSAAVVTTTPTSPPPTEAPSTEAVVTSTVPATTVPSTTPPEVEDEPSDGGAIPWGPVAIFIGAIAAFVYWMMNREDEEGGCEPLLRVWNEEIARTARVRERLEAASEFLNDRLLGVSELESQHAEYSEASEGPRGGTGGLDMVRLEGEMIGYDGLMEMIAETARQLTEAQDAASRALDEFNDREATYNEQVTAENAAREAYEACIAAKAAAAAPPPAPTPEPTSGGGEGTSTPPSAPASVTRQVTSYPERDAGCEEQGPVMVPTGSPFRIRLYRDFDVMSQVSNSSAHSAEKYGKEMATGLKQLGVTLGTVGALLSGGSAGLKGASAAGSFQTGKIVKGSLDGVKGTVSGLQGASVLPPVPTNLPELVVGGLQATANLGSLIAGKVTEWMGENNLIKVRITYYFQVVSIQPTQIWECEDGTWQCKTRVNVYSVGNVEAQRGPAKRFTVKGVGDKRGLRGQIIRMTSSGRNRIINSAKALADWESKNAPGDCR